MLNSVSPTSQIHIYLAPGNVILFKNRVFVGTIKLKLGHAGLGINPMTSVLIRREIGVAAISQRVPRVAGNYQDPGSIKERYSPLVFRRVLTLPPPSYQNCSFQKHEKINFYSCSQSVCGVLLQQS